MKKIKIFIIGIAMAALLPGCSEYLEVVPDNVLTLEQIFSSKESAYSALSRAYWFLPRESDTHATTWTLGDEYIGRLDLNGTASNLRAIRIMRGLQTSSDPILGQWSGTQGAKHLYRGINNCEVFLNYIHLTRDMSEKERNDWISQVTFLKAYYCWLLVQKYGPIVLPLDQLIDPAAPSNILMKPRSKIDECFDYIIKLMDEAIPNLSDKTTLLNYGQIDKIAATAIKARVLVFRASPFYNGNKEYYGDFYDHDGKTFFPMEYNAKKWEDALKALNEAIEVAEFNQKTLYTYKKDIYWQDTTAFRINNAKMKVLYDTRMVIVDHPNDEMCWPNTNINYYNDGEISASTNMRLPAGYVNAGDEQTAGYSWQWLGGSYQLLERFYTKNGLPIDEDINFDRAKMYDVMITPGETDPAYNELRGYLQPNSETLRMYLDREPRFYAAMGITGGYWRAHSALIKTKMYQNSDGGYNSSQNTTDFYPGGIGIQKFVHPESRSGAWQRTIKYAYPIIRLADLYLMKAEALNEISGPSQEVWNLINKVRQRAGIPNVEQTYSDATIAKNVNRHRTKEGLRDIILEERSIEFMGEGLAFWDMHRYKRAANVYNAPIYGWKHDGTTAQTFFVLEAKQTRRFLLRDYLWPISIEEMNTNGKLIQNPGW